MEREEILRIISGSPLSVYLSEEDKMEIIKRILSISKSSSGTISYRTPTETDEGGFDFNT